MGIFLIGLAKIILLDIVLSGDNAVVIALACRDLPPGKQKIATIFGSMGAVALRIVLTFIAIWLLAIPFVNLVGGVLILWIAIKLLKEEEDSDKISTSSSLLGAIKTIIIADFIMSLDNIIAIAGAAQGSIILIVIGLLISMPLIMLGSQIIMRLMSKYPVLVFVGSAILGYTAGEMILEDKVVGPVLESMSGHYIVPASLALLVIVAGKLLSIRAEHKVA